MKKLILIHLFVSLLFIPFFAFPEEQENTAKCLEKEFISIGESAGSAVVTISVVQTINTPYSRQGTAADPFFDEFFNRFFGGGAPREFKQKGMGSGFIINKDGYILTNDHVVGNADDIEVTLPDGRKFKANIMGSDKRSDIALIKINGDNLPFIKLGDSDKVKPGQWCIAMGNPFGNIVNNPKPTITAGIVSAVHRTINIREEDRMYGDLIQTDAAINQGNSGGPLVNIDGEVIGINTLIFSTSGGNVGIGFAIPINRGKAILDDLISGREVKHGWIGLWLQDINVDILKQFNLPPEKSGSLVFKVESESPAETAGFVSGDIILRIDGQPVNNSNDVTRIISGKRPGENAKCTVYRKEKNIDLTITIGERKENPRDRLGRNETKIQSAEWRGVVPENITEEIAGELNLQSMDGIIVAKVKFGSSAFNARIQPGDIIYSIAQIPVNNVQEFAKITRKFAKGNVLVHTSRGFVVLFEEK